MKSSVSQAASRAFSMSVRVAAPQPLSRPFAPVVRRLVAIEGVSMAMGDPQNDWFLMEKENPTKMDDLGVPSFMAYGHLHLSGKKL